MSLQPKNELVVLFVDDEEKSQKYFKRVFEDHYSILTASSAEEGIALFLANRDDIAIVVSDQKMPGEQGAELLEHIHREKPETIRILSTAYADIDGAIDAVNLGRVYRYITKPWDIPELEITLKQAAELYQLREDRDRLMRHKLVSLHNLLVADRVIALGLLGLGHEAPLKRVGLALQSILLLIDDGASPLGLTRDNLNDPNYWQKLYQIHKENLSKAMDSLNIWSEAVSDPLEGETDLVAMCTEIESARSDVQSDLDAEKTIVWKGGINTWTPLISRFFDALIKFSDSRQLTLVNPDNRPESLGIIVRGPMFNSRLTSLFQPEESDNFQTSLDLLVAYMVFYHLGINIERSWDDQEDTTLRLSFGDNGSKERDQKADFIRDVISNDVFWGEIFKTQ